LAMLFWRRVARPEVLSTGVTHQSPALVDTPNIADQGEGRSGSRKARLRSPVAQARTQ